MNLGFPEMMFLFVIALLIFGPKKLPEIGRQVGKAMTEFKRASNDFKAQLDSEVRQLELDEASRKFTELTESPDFNARLDEEARRIEEEASRYLSSEPAADSAASAPEGTVPVTAPDTAAPDVATSAATVGAEAEQDDSASATRSEPSTTRNA